MFSHIFPLCDTIETSPLDCKQIHGKKTKKILIRQIVKRIFTPKNTWYLDKNLRKSEGLKENGNKLD